MQTTYYSSVFSTQTNRIGSSMVTGDENTIKLIYAIHDITLMVTLSISGTWSNDHSRTFRVSYPDDDYGEVCANGNAPCVIKGEGNYMITVDADAPRYCKTFGDGP
jgi:hypothetical protein